MKAETIAETAESFINGNIGWAKKKVKRMTKREFYFLLNAICVATGKDMEPVANALTN